MGRLTAVKLAEILFPSSGFSLSGLPSPGMTLGALLLLMKCPLEGGVVDFPLPVNLPFLPLPLFESSLRESDAGGDLRDGDFHADHLFDTLQMPFFIGSHQGDGGSPVPRPCRAADAVNVIFIMGGNVKIDDMRHQGGIQPAG